MVWGLYPADPLSGEEKYFIFTRGTFKVGRKGCDVIINKDKGVSRVHAEIIVDAMTSVRPTQNESNNIPSKVRLRDCSKYGTFINKNLESKQKVHEYPSKEAVLKSGDLISFGTGNATYRFCYVPLVFYCSSPSKMNQCLQDKVLSIGGCITQNVNQECTHVLISPHIDLKEDLIDAVVAKRPFVLDSWVEFVAEKSIRTEIPSYSSFVPALMVEGASVEVADPRAREKCLEGCNFVLDSTKMYKFGDKLQSLLEVGGGKVCSIEVFRSSSQDSQYGENNRAVLVIPWKAVEDSENFRKVSSLSRVNEMDLICAVLSGSMDTSKLIMPPVVVSSSCSTDETVVADSDEDEEAATFAFANASVSVEEATKYETKESIIVKAPEVYDRKEPIIEGASVDEDKDNYAVTKLDEYHHDDTCWNSSDPIKIKRDRGDEPESANSDIVYSQDLIVKSADLPARATCTGNSGVVNFKRFRKSDTQSGNSFDNLIPFAKYPYKESDYGSEDVVESIKEEKKRKQMEAVSDDLFNNQKRKRRGTSGSLRELFCS